jgi:hypothetical protein
MNGWIFALVIGGVCLLWLVKWLYSDPAEREHQAWLRECMDKQARERGGAVKVVRGSPALTVPYKTVNIELRLVESYEDILREHTYARFRTEVFHDKQFQITLNTKELILKPLVTGTRLEVPGEAFNEKYVVVGNDASFVSGLLTEEVRDKLLEGSLQVKLGRRTDSSTLSRERGWLSVFTQGASAGGEVFTGLIETAGLFYERLDALNSRAG